jgi:hypothetical protein
VQCHHRTATREGLRERQDRAVAFRQIIVSVTIRISTVPPPYASSGILPSKSA